MIQAFSGRVWKFGDNVSGDIGILDFETVRDHSRPFDEVSLAELCFKTINPDFPKQVKSGDIVVGGINFAKPGHDQVVVAIRDCGVAAIICESCEARFVRKGINIGLPILVSPGISEFVEQDHELEVDLTNGLLKNLNTGKTLQTEPYPQRLLDILRQGGIITYLVHTLGETAKPAETKAEA